MSFGGGTNNLFGGAGGAFKLTPSSQPPNSSQPAQSLASTTSATPAGSIFGSGSGGGSIFGGSTGGMLGGAKPASGTFGSASGTSGVFGSSPGTTNTPLFSGLNAGAASTTPAPTRTTNLFQNSTTPAGTPASVFGGLNPASNVPAKTGPAKTLFNLPAIKSGADSAQSTPSSTTPANATSKTASASQFSFGITPAPNASSAAAPAASSTTTSGAFGATANPAPTPTPAPTTTTPSAFGGTTSTSGPFGSFGSGGGAGAGAGGSSMFGGHGGTGEGGGGNGGGGGGSGAEIKVPEAPKNPGLGASTTGPSPQQSRLKNKTMDEIITRWATDLSKYQKDFQDQATRVASWDRLLVENGEKIQKLYSSAFEAERATKEVEAQLSMVEGQQGEVEDWLDRYEKDVDAMFAQQIGDQLQGADQERERVYKLAEKMSDRLTDMGKDLTQMIDEINDAQAALNKTNKPDDPLSSIVRVLNGHLSQLQWIDTTSAALQKKITAQKQQAQVNNGGGMSGGGDTADEFYRSWRRQ